MKTDDAFREKILAVEDIAGKIAFIKSEGFDCTGEEVDEVMLGEGLEFVTGGGLRELWEAFLERVTRNANC
nr:Nif11-like leader peptide family RiPP precursor [Pelodictyon luteolum]